MLNFEDIPANLDARLTSIFNLENEAKRNILFLENGFDLYKPAQNMREWIADKRVITNALFRIKELPTAYLLDKIRWSDVIVFSTQLDQWTEDLKETIEKIDMPPITFVECFISQPTIRVNKTAHNFYAIETFENEVRRWKIHHITNKYWFK